MADQIALPTEPVADPPVQVVTYTKDKDGFFWRRFGEHRIAHMDLILYERVKPFDVAVVSVERVVEGVAVTADEWTQALKRTVKYLLDADAKLAQRREALRDRLW